MRIPLIDLAGQYREIKDELDAVWFETMEGAAFIGGPVVAALEDEVAAYVGARHCITCGNGTDGLALALEALGVGPGDEVITTPYSFFATAEAIVRVGATPVFVDIEPDTYNLDASRLEQAVTPATKAIVPVHLFGQCADMDAVLAVARAHGLVVVEDACQAIGATYRGRRAGSLGDAAVFSFFPSKNLGCAGDGGCVTTSDQALARRVRLLATHGSSSKHLHEAFGTNSRLDALQAGILRVKLRHLDRWNGQRRAAARVYDELLAGAGGIVPPTVREYGVPVHHLYMVRSAVAQRITVSLATAGIGTAVHYPRALHQQAAFEPVEGWHRPWLPVAEACAGTTFALPLFPGITRDQQETVAALVVETAR